MPVQCKYISKSLYTISIKHILYIYIYIRMYLCIHMKKNKYMSCSLVFSFLPSGFYLGRTTCSRILGLRLRSSRRFLPREGVLSIDGFLPMEEPTVGWMKLVIYTPKRDNFSREYILQAFNFRGHSAVFGVRNFAFVKHELLICKKLTQKLYSGQGGVIGTTRGIRLWNNRAIQWSLLLVWRILNGTILMNRRY